MGIYLNSRGSMKGRSGQFLIAILFVFVLKTVPCDVYAQTPTPTPFVGNSIDVDFELSLLVDSSGSIKNDEFELQKQGYADAFRSEPVRIAVQKAGKIAVNLIYWSSSSRQEEAIPFTLITVDTLEDFAQKIEATERPFGGGTRIYSVIDFAVPLFENQFNSRKQIIDISGDGTSSRTSTEEAVDRALAAGIDSVNGLPIGENDSGVYDFYRDHVIGGENPFIVASPTFEDFKFAATEKISRELGFVDECPTDPFKTSPGECGCGIADTDVDSNGIVDCSDECGLKPSVEMRNGTLVSTESLAIIGIKAARRLAKQVKPVAGQSGLGINQPLIRFIKSSKRSIQRTRKLIAAEFEVLPEVLKPCPGPEVCAVSDNTESKERLLHSVKRLKRLGLRILRRSFFYNLVENPQGAIADKPLEERQKRARKRVVKKRKEVRAMVKEITDRISNIPDATELCQ